MSYKKKYSISHKILLIPALGAISFIVYMAITTMTAVGNSELLEDARDIRFPLLQYTEKNLVNLERIKEALLSAASTGEMEGLDKAEILAKNVIEALQQSKTLDQGSMDELQKIEKHFQAYYIDAHKLSSQMVDGTVDFSGLAERSKRLNDAFSDTENELKIYRDATLSSFTGQIDLVNKQAHAMVNTGYVLGTLTIIILFCVSIPVASSIKTNLSQVIDSLREIAQGEGDLTVRIPERSKDEIGELVFWFNSFADKLQAVMSDVLGAISPLTEHVNSLNKLAKDAHEAVIMQQAGADETRSAVSNMNDNAMSIANHAAEAANNAKQASKEACNGQAVVEGTVKSIQFLAQNVDEAANVIQQLEQDSLQVSMVTDVIRGIAEQTNLLALNAAIEAARAGDQGRGFAIVATEVRGLASRTQEATAEINITIEKLQTASRHAVTVMETGTKAAESSVETANSAHQSLEVITNTIGQITDMNLQVADSTDKQQEVSSVIVGQVEKIKEESALSSQRAESLSGVSSDIANLTSVLEKASNQFKV